MKPNYAYKEYEVLYVAHNGLGIHWGGKLCKEEHLSQEEFDEKLARFDVAGEQSLTCGQIEYEKLLLERVGLYFQLFFSQWAQYNWIREGLEKEESDDE